MTFAGRPGGPWLADRHKGAPFLFGRGERELLVGLYTVSMLKL